MREMSEEDFTPPPLETLMLGKELREAQAKIDDLKVVIDTAQAALRRAEATLSKEDLDYVINPSAKWVLSFKCS